MENKLLHFQIHNFVVPLFKVWLHFRSFSKSIMLNGRYGRCSMARDTYLDIIRRLCKYADLRELDPRTQSGTGKPLYARCC